MNLGELLFTVSAAAVVLILAARAMYQGVTVYEWETVLHYADGRFVDVLGPGRHRIFRGLAKISLIRVPTLGQMGASGLADVSSAERLPFRMSAWYAFRVTDPRAWHERAGLLTQSRTVAAALVEVAAGMKIEELLAGRAEADARLHALVATRLDSSAIERIGIDAVQLPPETRRLFVEIEKARFEGLAALERARGEHAALRSLANAARMLKDNPELMNLRLLQAVGSGQNTASTIVIGQGAFDPATPVRGLGS